MRWVFMQGFLVLAMEKGVMPTSVNPPLWERARDRQTAKQPWPQQEAANQALSTDNPQQLTEGVRVMAVVRVLAMAEVREADTVVEMAEVMAVATEVGTVVAMVVATEPPSNRR
jgi:hypothetical protein